MDIQATSIPEVKIIAPKKFGDARGFFSETYNQRAFHAAGITDVWIQDNHSLSGPKGTVRGLHFQTAPFAQAKLVRVTRGAILDVAVDIRPDSPSFGTWVACEISAENHRQLWVPAGLAHGFLVLSESAEVLYKTTDYYSPPGERCIVWNDPELAIEWPLTAEPVVSAKDQQGLSFAEAVPHVQA